MKVGICSLGCKVNIYESELVTNILKDNNYEIVDFEDKADIYIINTCSVTNESDKKSRKMINRAKKNNPNAIIVVMGCYSQVNSEDIDVDIVLGNKDKSKILEIIEDYIKTKEKKKIIYNLNKVDFEKMEISNFASHTRAFVKVQDGCNAFCSYCIIPYTRGRVRSKNKDGRWRKKRADAGFPRKLSADVLEFLEMLRKREEDGTLGKVKRKSCDDEIF